MTRENIQRHLDETSTERKDKMDIAMESQEEERRVQMVRDRLAG